MGPKTFELSAAQKHAAFCYLMDHINDNSKTGLKWGILAKCAKNFNVDRSAMSKFWRETCWKMIRDGKSVNGARTDFEWFKRKTETRGYKPKYNRQELRKQVKKLMLKEQKNLQSMAVATGVPLTTLHHMLKTEKVLEGETGANGSVAGNNSGYE